jgi:Bacteriophage minor capsid protein
MLTVADITAFLVASGITALIESGYELVEQPDRVVFVTPNGGPGEKRERVFEDVTVQIRTRGAQNDPADAQALAAQVDGALMGPHYPITVGGHRVVSIVQAGGSPAIIGRDEARRYECSASYVLDIER